MSTGQADDARFGVRWGRDRCRLRDRCPRAQALADERTKLVGVLRAIKDEDWNALDLSTCDREAVRLSQGEADYLVIDAMKLAARRVLEDIGEFG